MSTNKYLLAIGLSVLVGSSTAICSAADATKPAAAPAATATDAKSSASHADHSHAAGDPIAHRKQMMKDVGDAMKASKKLLDSSSTTELLTQAKKIQAGLTDIPTLFPKGTEKGGKTEAKPTIWEKWADFEKVSKDSFDKAGEFVTAVSGGDKKAINAKFGELGQTCKSCHKDFRVEK